MCRLRQSVEKPCVSAAAGFLCLFVVVCLWSFFFFFQAEDGIRDSSVTGVQTCALPILEGRLHCAWCVLAQAPTRPGSGTPQPCRWYHGACTVLLLSLGECLLAGAEVGRGTERRKRPDSFVQEMTQVRRASPGNPYRAPVPVPGPHARMRSGILRRHVSTGSSGLSAILRPAFSPPTQTVAAPTDGESELAPMRSRQCHARSCLAACLLALLVFARWVVGAGG